jgi:hypothetical protein
MSKLLSTEVKCPQCKGTASDDDTCFLCCNAGKVTLDKWVTHYLAASAAPIAKHIINERRRMIDQSSTVGDGTSWVDIAKGNDQTVEEFTRESMMVLRDQITEEMTTVLSMPTQMAIVSIVNPVAWEGVRIELDPGYVPEEKPEPKAEPKPVAKPPAKKNVVEPAEFDDDIPNF